MWLSDGYILQLRPEPEFSGDLALLVKPIVKNWDGNVDTGKELEIIMKVTTVQFSMHNKHSYIQIRAVNDAPAPKEKLPTEMPLVPFDIKLNTGINVGKLAGMQIIY